MQTLTFCRHVRQICYVFSLDEEIKPDVDVMKRGLLKLLHVREFSKEAQFKNPSRSLVRNSLHVSVCLCLCQSLGRNHASRLSLHHILPTARF